jgi:hypothetical protein
VTKTILGAAVSLWLVSVPAYAQHWHDDHEHWQKHAKHQDDEEDREIDRHMEGCFFQAADVYVVSGYYAPRYHPLPPGLKKKFYRTGHLPDGWEKKMEALPADVERQLVPIPRDYRRGILDGHFILYYPRTGAVLDSVVLFPPK